MLLKIQNVGKKQKTKKKNLKPLPSLHSHPIPLIFLPLPSWSGPPSALSPGKGRKPGGGIALGTCSRSPPPPSAGLGGVSGLFMYLLHTHQPMQVPHPGPSLFLCLCSFPSNSQGFSSSPPTSPGKWDGQGPPRLESAGCPF